MADITICDLCEDEAPLKASTGRYVVTVTRYIKTTNDKVSTTQDTEYDVCGACMAKLRKAGLNPGGAS